MACVTLDHDFHSHLATSFADSPSVVFLRIEGLSAALQAELIQRVWEVCGEAIEAGAAVSCNGTSIRLKKLGSSLFHVGKAGRSSLPTMR